MGICKAAAESVGLSCARIDRLKAVFRDYIGGDQMSGAVVVVLRGGGS